MRGLARWRPRRALARRLLPEVAQEDAMMTPQTQVRRCTVYRGRGHADELTMELDPIEPGTPSRAPVADRVSIRTIMSRELLCVRPDLDISTVVGLMMEHRIGCLPVVDERRRPVGIITKLDLVEQLDAAMRLSGGRCPLPTDLAARTADDVMMPIALTLDEHATVAHTASMMVSEDIHHVLVVSGDGALIGVVSAKDIARWVAE
jgi:CBS domain-containing protein